ncbi:hypothetical protein [Crateriforma spongiae]|uniref:hypothetical protein n=1 Tax=Crateriforma spongiae TaxID=2724528 RepID=UPI0039AF004A
MSSSAKPIGTPARVASVDSPHEPTRLRDGDRPGESTSDQNFGSDRANDAAPLNRAGNQAGHAAATKPAAMNQPNQSAAVVAAYSLIGATMFVFALGPFGLGKLGFLVATPWAMLTLDARRITPLGYLAVYLSGLLMWLMLLLLEGSTATVNWTMGFGQIVYLATALPLFIGIGRAGRSVWMAPSYLWLPVAWSAVEYLRANLFGGFGLGQLAHAVTDSPQLLQLTDLLGSVGLSALMIGCGASVAEVIWITRRLRRLERHIPMPEAATTADDLTAPSLAPSSQGKPVDLSRPMMVRRRESAFTSMQAAIRRNRDRARDQHLGMAALAILFTAGMLYFARYYGFQRVQETRNWKLFESSLYPLSVIGGSDSQQILRREFESRAAKDVTLRRMAIARYHRPLLLTALDAPPLIRMDAASLGMIDADGDLELPGAPPDDDLVPIELPGAPALVIYRQGDDQQAEAALNVVEYAGPVSIDDDSNSDRPIDQATTIASTTKADGPWVVEMNLSDGGRQLESLDPAATAVVPTSLWRPGCQSVSASDPAGAMPLRLACCVTSSSNIEIALREILSDAPEGSTSVDLAVIVMPTRLTNATRWPRLMTRAVLAAAVANRCPLVGLVPDESMVVANCDGKLFCSSIGSKSLTPSVFENWFDEGFGEAVEQRGDVVEVRAMIDPRESFYVRSAGWFPFTCLLLSAATVVATRFRGKRSRNQVSTTQENGPALEDHGAVGRPVSGQPDAGRKDDPREKMNQQEMGVADVGTSSPESGNGESNGQRTVRPPIRSRGRLRKPLSPRQPPSPGSNE